MKPMINDRVRIMAVDQEENLELIGMIGSVESKPFVNIQGKITVIVNIKFYNKKSEWSHIREYSMAVKNLRLISRG